MSPLPLSGLHTRITALLDASWYQAEFSDHLHCSLAVPRLNLRSSTRKAGEKTLTKTWTKSFSPLSMHVRHLGGACASHPRTSSSDHSCHGACSHARHGHIPGTCSTAQPRHTPECGNLPVQPATFQAWENFRRPPRSVGPSKSAHHQSVCTACRDPEVRLVQRNAERSNNFLLCQGLVEEPLQ